MTDGNKTTYGFGDFDMTKVFADMKMPAFNMEAMLATQRRNMEALAQANQLAVENTQALMRRQSEIVRQSMEEMQTMMNSMVSEGAPEEKMAKQAEMMRTNFEKMLANMKELADMVSKSNSEAADVINQRISATITELTDTMSKQK